MLRNAELSNLMQVIVSRLMPICEKQANPELWCIYEEMQKWEMLTNHKMPFSDKDEPLRTAQAIRSHLGNLSDRNLALAIERALV